MQAHPTMIEKDRDEDILESPHRSHLARTTFLVILVGAIGAAAWYAYPAAKQRYASLLTLPAMSQTVSAVRAELDQQRQKLADSSLAQQAFVQDLDKVRHDFGARLETASARAARSAQDAYARLQQGIDTEVENRTEAVAGLKDRVATLQASNDAARAQVSELTGEVTRLREQQNNQSQDLARLQNQMTEASTGAGERFAALERDADTSRRAIGTISDQIAVTRIPFEAAKHRESQIADGVSLHLSGTNLAHRSVTGWIWLAGETRTIWLRNQPAQQPVTFYGSRDGQRRELVITNVGANSVTGYLVVPKQAPSLASSGSE